MQFINRSIAIIKPKQPFVDWINATDPNSEYKPTLEQIRCDPTCILIPEFERPSEAKAYIKKTYNDIWQWELHAWWTDTKAYPENRSFVTFCLWFDVEFSSEVFDWLDSEIEKEEL